MSNPVRGQMDAALGPSLSAVPRRPDVALQAGSPHLALGKRHDARKDDDQGQQSHQPVESIGFQPDTRDAMSSARSSTLDMKGVALVPRSVKRMRGEPQRKSPGCAGL